MSVPDIAPGQVYGFRVHGPYAPEEGQRFNPNKLVLDPYARAHIGELKWDGAVFGYKVGDPQADLSFDERDSAPFVPRCVVVDPDFDWRREMRWHPVPWDRTDKFRDTVRDYWRGEARPKDLAARLCGSPDVFNRRGRQPWASVNFITAHDGFTLKDLVSYNEKHNEANGEGNRDGHEHNRSWNHGAEGPEIPEPIRALRKRQMKNLLATLLLAQGTPMLLAEALEVKDVTWINADGEEMREAHWDDSNGRCFGMLLDGRAQETGIRRRGELATLLIIFNSWHDVVNFKLPAAAGWTLRADTNFPDSSEEPQFAIGHVYEVTARSLLLFQLT